MDPMLPTINQVENNNLYSHESLDVSEPIFENPEYQELAEITEASIAMEWRKCKKKQGHDGFIPWNLFVSDPGRYCKEANLTLTETTLKYILAIGNVTARLEVKRVSLNRPKLYTKLHKHRGKRHIFTGTGCVVYDVNVSKYPCRCIKCTKIARTNKKVKITTYSVYIATATHVVYDDEEAINLTVDLHYDDNERKAVKKIHGVRVCERSVNGDYCVVECVTCDEQVANEIKTNLENYKLFYRGFPRSDEPVVVIISHPHAKPKHISFGKCKIVHTKRNKLFSLTTFEYDAATCPGSSGAFVLLMKDTCEYRGFKFVMPNCPAHSGVDSKGHNFSATSANPTLKKNQEILVLEKKKKALQEDQSNGSSEGYAVHEVGCTKNPGHKEFIPVNDFSINHLPEGCRDIDLVELVGCLAGLTVFVKVMVTSQGRPEFWPGTKHPYAFYDKRGGDVTRLSTGIILLIYQIRKEQNMFCNCSKCKNSDAPRKARCYIYMKTAAHVVFDDVEARRTTARLFYDNHDSPLVTLVEWRVVDCDIAGDTIYLECVTCDAELADKLLKMTKTFWDAYEKIEDKYNSANIAIILSHPHGCPKQVSVGRVLNDYKLAENYDTTLTKHTYTTCTCAGSSGAAVFILSKDVTPVIEKYVTHHVHSDALDSGLNKCSFAVDTFN